MTKQIYKYRETFVCRLLLSEMKQASSSCDNCSLLEVSKHDCAVKIKCTVLILLIFMHEVITLLLVSNEDKNFPSQKSYII